ncbi:hypothetical protein R3W88_024798 [Solanum pinnatisectum]|uniref:Uncharacterized protein n=1 Tax=Solanum pinnatisectum TaxID=50273 RepID=A0AAV9M4J6_9SOLN|nr:hypothetical protein R3W88_024798 [Solanum pinnatisectum]
MASRKRSMSKDVDMHVLYKEMDGASCPICMNHPHNAVLLLCSSHDKGFRSYICDTRNLDIAVETPAEHLKLRNLSDRTVVHGYHDIPANEVVATGAFPGGSEENGNSNRDNRKEMQEGALQTSDAVTVWGSSHETANADNSSDSLLKLKCPMCRGDVLGWNSRRSQKASKFEA